MISEKIWCSEQTNTVLNEQDGGVDEIMQRVGEEK